MQTSAPSCFSLSRWVGILREHARLIRRPPSPWYFLNTGWGSGLLAVSLSNLVNGVAHGAVPYGLWGGGADLWRRVWEHFLLCSFGSLPSALRIPLLGFAAGMMLAASAFFPAASRSGGRT